MLQIFIENKYVYVILGTLSCEVSQVEAEAWNEAK